MLRFSKLPNSNVAKNAKNKHVSDSESSDGEAQIMQMVELSEESLESQPIQRRKKKTKKNKLDDGERNLEKLIFGDGTDILKTLNEDAEKEITVVQTKKKPVWEDADDVNIKTKSVLVKKKERHEENYSKHLEERFINTYGEAKWAQLDRNEKDSDSDDDILKTSGNLLGQYTPLPPDNIQLIKCSNLNYNDASQKPIRSVKFHPTSQVALVANGAGKTTLFQVDGKTNSKIQSIQFEQFPISCASFSTDGEEIIVGSRKCSHFFYYHMIQGKIVKVPWDKGLGNVTSRRIFVSPDGRFLILCGPSGYIHLLSAKTKEWIGQLKMNDDVIAIAFNPSGNYMYSHGTLGQVYVWDMLRRICVGQFYDEGCITGTSLAVSPNDQYLATGSDTGVVNVYETLTLSGNSNPKPMKTFMNLTTEVSALKFNHSSELLAMSSDQKEEAVKLAHFPSRTVFSNFPLQHRKLNVVTSMDISINSGFLSLANQKGTVQLYRIKKYGNY